MNHARLSVILPVRNAEATMGAAIDSCLTQTFRDFELLVVLNGCTDRSGALAVAAAGRDPRVRVLESPAAGGVTEAMRTGVAAASASVIARADADDVSHPARFARQWDLLERDPSLGAVSCRVRLIDGLGDGMQRYVDWVNSLETPEDVARERFVECPVIQPSVMLRRAVLDSVGGYRMTAWAEDHDLWLRMLAAGVRFGKTDATLLDWRDGPGRLTRTHPMYGDEQVWRMKAHHLARMELVWERGVAICGAGPIGKRLHRLLAELGVAVHGFFEVHPRRIGETIGGVPVAGPDAFGMRWADAVLLSAVGVPGGRDRVRELATSAGYAEGSDFWCCC